MMVGRRAGGFILPLLLIATGIVLLLNNLGILAWDVWDLIIRLWPILLIALGLDLMIGRSSRRWWPAVLVLVVVLIGALFALFETNGQRMTERPFSQGLEGVTQADVSLICSSCSLQLGASSTPGMLIEGTVTLGWRENLRHSYMIAGEKGEFTLASQQLPSLPLSPKAADKPWRLRLTPNIPLRLRVELEEKTAVLNLERLNLVDLDIETGRGECTIILPRNGRLEARIRGGGGDVTIEVPKGVGLRVFVEAGSKDVHLPIGYECQGDTYLSPTYATAPARIDLRLIGNGRISVQERTSI
jgi:hypothetical protein